MTVGVLANAKAQPNVAPAQAGNHNPAVYGNENTLERWAAAVAPEVLPVFQQLGSRHEALQNGNDAALARLRGMNSHMTRTVLTEGKARP